jgi:hypothetical protein
MEMASEKTLRQLTERAVKRTKLDELADKTLELQTADKFRLAAMLLDAGIPDLAGTVGKRAVDEIEISKLLAGK